MLLPATAVLLAVHLAHGQSAAEPLHEERFRAAAGGYAVVSVTVAESGDAPPAAALNVLLDGTPDHLIVLTPGVGRTEYSTLVGPLRGGEHTIALTWSTLWPAPSRSVRIASSRIDAMAPSDPRAIVLAHAPVLGLRADTIGTSSDLPLLMYVEDERREGDGWLRYTVIFSNEDGGTAAAALMARWGRTTDIELIYEVELRAGRVAQARYQGPDHRMLAPSAPGPPPPRFTVATLNNMVVDRGVAAATVRLVPETVRLAGRSRESVMDEHPWTYRVMARELTLERPALVTDPRDFVYVDLRLDRTTGAAVAIGVRSPDGTMRWSDRGRSELVVARSGEARIAVPVPAAGGVAAVAVRCDARPQPPAGPEREEAGCAVRIRHAVRLTADYTPGPRALIDDAVALPPGVSREVLVSLPATVQLR